MGKDLMVVSSEQKALVKSVIFPDATDAELQLFIYECTRRGVHPLDRKIFPIKRNDGETGSKKITFQCSIDYFRSAALESEEYDGQDEPEFGPVDIQGYPEWAKVAVYRKGIDRPFIGIARWKEYYPGEKLGFMWRKMPHAQLAKCAEALAMRKAFPQKLAGLYADEETHQTQSGNEQTGTTSLKDTIKEAPTGSTANKANAATKDTRDIKTIETILKEELEAYEPDPAARQEVLKAISIFGKKGSEKWIMSIDKASENWCAKALENLRKLPPKKKSETSTEEFPADCTKNPCTCSSSQWIDAVTATCGFSQKACPFKVKAEG